MRASKPTAAAHAASATPGRFALWPMTRPSRPLPMFWAIVTSIRLSFTPRPTSPHFVRSPCRGQSRTEFMGTCLFRSPLAPRLQAFWETHYARSRGGLSNQKILIYLDRFLIGELKKGQTISRPVVERWNESMASLSPNTRINRLCVLRRFCRYLHYFDPETC